MIDWEDIRRQHGDVVWTTCYRILACEADALDCFQDVFLEAIRREGEAIENWAAWLRWLATRRSIDQLRRRKRQPLSNDSLDPIAHSGGPEDQVAYDELMEAVRDEMSKLKPEQSQAFWLGCVERLPYDEIASQMQITKGHVGVLVHRARERVRARLTQRQLAPHREANS